MSEIVPLGVQAVVSLLKNVSALERPRRENQKLKIKCQRERTGKCPQLVSGR